MRHAFPWLALEIRAFAWSLLVGVSAAYVMELIENAVRHGIAPLVEGGTIRIESKLQGAQLQIRVQNSGPASSGLVAPKEPANGIGIHNTAERLKTLYAANHKFVLQWPEAGGCEVTVELPFRKSAQPEVSSCER
jgi:two-component system sensor histidine kinase AlgZ